MRRCLTFIFLVFVSALGQLNAQGLIFQENKDGWVCSCQPNGVMLGQYPNLYQGVYNENNSKCFARTFIYWNLSSIPKDTAILNAKMELRCAAVHGSPTGQMVFYRITKSWNEKTMTDNTTPSYTSQDSIVCSWPLGGRWLSIDILKFVQFWIANPDSNFGIMGHSANSTGSATGAVELIDCRHSNLSFRPKLTINSSIAGTKQGSLIPQKYNLNIYPNPFNPQLNIQYTLDHSSLVSLTVADMSGREVNHFNPEYREAGEHRSVWNAGGFPSGIYFVTLQTSSYRIVKKAVLLK